MKKTYKNPEIAVIKMQIRQMIASSLPISSSEVDNGLGHETEEEW